MRTSKYRHSANYSKEDLKNLDAMIRTLLGMKDECVLLLNDNDYRLTFRNNELCLGSKVKLRKSPIESLVMSDYRDKVDGMKLLLEQCPIAYSALDEEERLIFKAIYFDNLSYIKIMELYPYMYPDKIRLLKTNNHLLTIRL